MLMNQPVNCNEYRTAVNCSDMYYNMNSNVYKSTVISVEKVVRLVVDCTKFFFYI